MTAEIDIAVIGGGPAGLAAAAAAKKRGAKNVVIIERAPFLGGILPQCVHNGFGLHIFKEELTGPEYARRCVAGAIDAGVAILLNTMVIGVTSEKVITAISRERGAEIFSAKAIILAMGCRERTRGNIGIAGTRPAGVLTAGTAQKLVNVEGYSVGKTAVVLGSGDVGLIMARRLTLEGAKVLAVCEIMPKSSGLERNVKQCLDDFGIPLLLNTTVCEIHGKERVEGVTIANVDENRNVISDTKRFIECDTLLLSVGLIPENELSLSAGVTLNDAGGAFVNEEMATNVAGIFACGNVVTVHDLVDFVSKEGAKAGENAAAYLRGENLTKYNEKRQEAPANDTLPAENEKRLTCIVCPVGCRLSVFFGESGAVERVANGKCARGENYAKEEFTAPKRTLTSVVRGENAYAPVKTNKTIPKELLRAAMREIKAVKLENSVTAGGIIIENILGTGADVIACSDVITPGKA